MQHFLSEPPPNLLAQKALQYKEHYLKNPSSLEMALETSRASGF